MKNNNGIIETDLYKSIHDKMPIFCVDLIVVKNDKFILTKRTNKPVQGKWWFPGGRVFKNEKMIVAVKRKAKEELGLNPKSIKFLGFDETFFPDGPFDGSTHTVNAIFAITINAAKEPKIDSQAESFRYFEKIDKKWHPYIKKSLTMAGFK